jgi:hypothetical protein
MGSDRLDDEHDDARHIESGHFISDEMSEMDVNLRIIRLFNLYRHDWMNEIQLLFGYVKLKKYDKLEGLMENIKVRVQRESYISKLGAPELIVYLFSFQNEVKELILDIEMEQEIHLNKLGLDSGIFGNKVMALIEAFKVNACHRSDREHSLKLGLVQASDRLEVICKYEGMIQNSLLLPALERVKVESDLTWKWKINQRDESYMTVHMEVPLTT